MKDLVDNKQLLTDVENIYLGNLGTIDTDMDLPGHGENGTKFTWQSDEHLFLTDDGKVTRPTPGVGNRVVNLTLTATLGEDSLTHEYPVTIIQEVRKIEIDHALNLTVDVHDENYSLPGVTVVQLKDDSYSTSEVLWDDNFDATSPRQTVHGRLKENELPVSLNINYQPQTDSEVENAFQNLRVELFGNSSYMAGYQSMLAHLKQTDPNKLLYNFRVAAGLPVNEEDKMTGWDAPDCNLRGHTTGHYMSALALAYFDSQDENYKKVLDYIVDQLAICQQNLEQNGAHTGFLSAYDETQFDKLEQYETYPNIWAPYYTLDKILSGLLDSYLYTHNEKALKIATEIGNWTYHRLSQLSHAQLTKMWSIYIAGEFGGMISAMVRLYRYTKNNSYLQTAKLFSNDKLFLPMQLGYDTLNNMHANQHIPQIIGAMDLYFETGDTNYLSIAINFWNIVVEHHAFENGGVGETEMFHEADKESEYLTDKSAETCASYNMIKLSRQLFDITQDTKYFDYVENALENHLVVANDHEDDGGSTYFLPLRPGGQKKYDTDEDNTCCHGSGLENMVRFQKDIFEFDGSRIYLNLFYDSTLYLPENRQIAQENGENSVIIHSNVSSNVELYIRIPQWMRNVKMTIAGKTDKVLVNDGYIKLTSLDKISEIRLDYDQDFEVRAVLDDDTLFSVFYGRSMLAKKSNSENFQAVDVNKLTEETELIPFNEIKNDRYHAYFKQKV